ncbi:hypothetical protein TNCV_3221783 [Trichonephila clavipes]|nr:hypothetical protein TNCV_3221783 [Trichonephila clavipes]
MRFSNPSHVAWNIAQSRPNDFFVFPKLKIPLQDWGFDNTDEVIQEVSNIKPIKNAVVKPKEVSDIDSNPKENKHFDVDLKDGEIQEGDTEKNIVYPNHLGPDTVRIRDCSDNRKSNAIHATLNTDIREDAALQLLKLSDMHSNQGNKLDSRDNGEIQMDAEVNIFINGYINILKHYLNL